MHFLRDADLSGDYCYRVKPAFMNAQHELSYGAPQEVAIGLYRETYPGLLNMTFTRAFVSSKTFVDRYVSKGQGMQTLIPANADKGLDFVPTHPKAKEALAWMGSRGWPSASRTPPVRRM